MAAGPDFSAWNTFGAKLDPEWAPLHQGWLLECPQLHQAYVLPSSRVCMSGRSPALLELESLMVYGIDVSIGCC